MITLSEQIELATASGVSTQVEEANQLLLLYYAAGDNKTIPLKKLKFIRRFADRAKLQDPRARKVLRKSMIAPVLWGGMTAVAAFVLAGVAYLLVTTDFEWHSDVIARHWLDGESGPVTSASLPGEAKVISGTFLGSDHVRIWDAKTAQRLATFENPGHSDPFWSDSFNFLMLGASHFDEISDNPRLYNIANNTLITLSVKGMDFQLVPSGRFLSWIEGITCSLRTRDGTGANNPG